MTKPTFIFALTGVLLLRYYGFAEAPQLPNTEPAGLDGTASQPDLLAFLNNRPYKELVMEAAVRYKLHPHLIDAVIQAESAYDPLAVSHKGAQGLMQLMPATSRLLGVDRPLDPRENILGGSRHLRSLLDTFNGNVTLALAAYNAGESAVLRYGGVPPYYETRRYVWIIGNLVHSGPSNKSTRNNRPKPPTYGVTTHGPPQNLVVTRPRPVPQSAGFNSNQEK